MVLQVLSLEVNQICWCRMLSTVGAFSFIREDGHKRTESSFAHKNRTRGQDKKHTALGMPDKTKGMQGIERKRRDGL